MRWCLLSGGDKRKRKNIGKGVEALISKKIEEPSEEKENSEKILLEVKTLTKGVRKIEVDDQVIADVIKRFKKISNVSTVDPFAVIYLHLLRLTIPDFKTSQELGHIVREYCKDNKELCDLIYRIINRIEG